MLATCVQNSIRSTAPSALPHDGSATVRRPPTGGLETADQPYIVYALRERASGRHYVGLSKRSLATRITSHLSQARRDRAIRDDGLMSALRRMIASGRSFDECFDARVVATAESADVACALEREWIARLSAAKPTGFNLLPGGSSRGGPGNAMPLAVKFGGDVRRFPTIGHAVGATNRRRLASGEAPLGFASVYERLSSGWTPEQALGLAHREDLRGTRETFSFDGKLYSCLRAVSDATGIAVDTLRSRLHRRADLTDGATVVDITCDRRRQNIRKASPLAIVWPQSGEALTVAEFAARTGLSKATVMHRWHRLSRQRAASGNGPASPVDVFAALTLRADRRREIRLTLPDGAVFIGGEREAVRWLLANQALAASRPCQLSESGIRRRLRLLDERARSNERSVQWAFGLVATRVA